MAVFKCKMCGGALEINNETVAVCEYCETQQTLPKLDDEKKAQMYDRANHFRRNNEFDKAMGIYEQILNEDSTDAESYWSLVLCRYGIEYVEDPSSHKRIPTVNRAQFTSIYDDDNYKSAIEYADSYQKAIYEEEAKVINDIQKGILEISQKEEPFDVFICYKETDNSGRRTPDSVLANDLYHQLTQEGFKVFFARITLEDKLGSAYEPYIFAALNSSKVMVVLGTKPEFFNAVWVKNEWSRYLALIKNGEKKMLIPAYKDMDPYDLPEEFSHLQAQDMSKLGFMQDLIRGIKKITAIDEPKRTVVKETAVANTTTATEPLLKRAFMFLEDGDWKSADEYCEKVLDIDPENGLAYFIKLMVEFNSTKLDINSWQISEIKGSKNYKNLFKYGIEHIDIDLDALGLNECEVENDELIKYLGLVKNVIIPQNITCVGSGAFYQLDFLKAVIIPDGVTTIDTMSFAECESLTSITIPKSITRIEIGAIEKCYNLKNIHVQNNPNFHFADGCLIDTKLKSLILFCNGGVIPTDGSVTCIASGAFSCCNSISSITIPSSITEIEDSAFYGCTSISNIIFDINSRYCFKDGCLIDTENKRLILYCDNGKIPTDGSVTTIGYRAFSNCKSLVSVTIPDSITEMDMCAFQFCLSLTEIVLSNNMTEIRDNTFDGCENLSSVIIPKSVTRIGDFAFSDCYALSTITIPKSVTNIGSCAFPHDITIMAETGSYAQKYAQDKHLAFKAFTPIDDNRITKFISKLKNIDSEQKNLILKDIENIKKYEELMNVISTKENEFLLLEQEKNNISVFAFKRRKELENKLLGITYELSKLKEKKSSYEIKYGTDLEHAIKAKEKELLMFNDLQNEREGFFSKLEHEYNQEILDKYTKILTQITNIQKGDIVTLGTYVQGDSEGIKEAIEWIVLEIKEGKALLISKYALDAKKYGDFSTYENCSLRNWLNNEFINLAFSTEEKFLIHTSTVKMCREPEYEIFHDSIIYDRIFLLSINEAEKYFDYDSERKCKPTKYVVSRGVYVALNGHCPWRLLPHGNDYLFPARVDSYGKITYNGWLSENNYFPDAIRPAMWISLE